MPPADPSTPRAREAAPLSSGPTPARRSSLAGTAASAGWREYGGTLLVVAGCTGIAAFMQRHFDPPNLTMIYLLGVVVSAIAFGRGPAVLAAVLSVATFDFAFVPPRFKFGVSDTQYLVTFGVMLVVAIVIGTLTAWLREQRQRALLREHRTAALHRLSRDLALGRTAAHVAASAAQRIAEAMEACVAVSLADPGGVLRVVAGDPGLVAAEEERTAARRAFENGQMVVPRAGSDLGLHLPLEAGSDVRGVLTIRPLDPRLFEDRERFHLLRSLASQTALAIERCRLAEDVERVRLEAETERARSALLSSVSHDLRTPLASITGAASSLRDGSAGLSRTAQEELADTIAEEAMRLNRLIGNLLDMTRLESGALEPHKEWYSLEEVVGAALERLEPGLGDRPVRLELADDLPLVSLDGVLFEQVVRNLVENAHKYSPPGAPIDIGAAVEGAELRLAVGDRGPGIAPGEERRLFEKFYRGASATGRPGVGLGLPICEAIVRAHGGTIAAANRQDGGAVFTVRLPLHRAPDVIGAALFDPEPAKVET